MMLRDNSLKKAFLISLFFHLVVLTPWPGVSFLRKKMKVKQRAQPFLVAYEIKQQNKIKFQSKKSKKDKGELKVQKKSQPVQNKNKVVNKQDKSSLKKVVTSKAPSCQKRKYEVKNAVVSLSEKNNSKIIPISILNYYSAIREEIKKSLFYHKPQSAGGGDVTVLFTISSDGVLQSLALDNVKSTKSDILRQTALKSVKYASPFPPFPPELKNDYITFSITIEFQLNPR